MNYKDQMLGLICYIVGLIMIISVLICNKDSLLGLCGLTLMLVGSGVAQMSTW